MLKADVAIIGGTGVAERLAELGGVPLVVPTPEGPLRGRLVRWEGLSLVTAPRHSAGHRTPPHRVNYKAIALGLRALGVRGCLSSAAVGSLRADWNVGHMATCTDMLDLSGRQLTLFDATVQHTEIAEPFPASKAILQSADALNEEVEPQAVYVCANGPRYETPREVKTMRALGGDVVGMTAASEAALMREAEVPYGCLAVVTNMGCGLGGPALEHGHVAEAMSDLGEKVTRILLEAAKTLAK